MNSIEINGYKVIMPTFSWEVPIEEELLRWVKYMKRQNLLYIQTTIWGRKQKREAEIYKNVFEMVEERIQREMDIRIKCPPKKSKP
jgi:hypothetical protein